MAPGSAITAVQRDMGDLWRDHRDLQEANNAALSTVERSVNKLHQGAVAARLRCLKESSARAEASILGCHATIANVWASVDANGLQLRGHIRNMSSCLDNLGQRNKLLDAQTFKIGLCRPKPMRNQLCPFLIRKSISTYSIYFPQCPPTAMQTQDRRRGSLMLESFKAFISFKLFVLQSKQIM